MGVEYLRYLASKWVFLATAIAAAIVTSLLGSAIVTKQYTATATLLIEPGAGFDPRAATAVSAMYLESLKTYEEFAASDSLFLRACDKFHLEHGAIESFKRRVLRVTKPRDTKLLQISVTLPEAKSAQAMAEFLATETVALNHSIADQGDQKLLQDFQTKRESTRTSLDQLRTEMSALTSSAQDATLETEARNLADLKTRLEEQRIDAAAYAAEAMKSKTISHHELAVEELKLKLFNNPTSITPPCSKGADLTPIMRPFFCELATSTPNILTAFVPRDFTSGLLPRYFLMYEKLRCLEENPNWTFDIPEGLVPLIEKQCNLASDETPQRTFEKEASDLLKKFSERVKSARERILEQPYSTSQEIHGASLTRLVEQAKKLTFLASEKDGSRYVVRENAVVWAISVVLLSYRNMREIIDNNIFENRTEQMRARVLDIIQKASNGKWVPKARTLRNITFLTRRELDDILIKLEEDGMIQIRKEGEKRFLIRSTSRRERNKR